MGTAYTYDVVNHLTAVTMPRPRSNATQIRYFNYDLSTMRLMSTVNPENGTVSYIYNPDNTVASKTDNARTVTRYTYDSWKRVTRIDLCPNATAPQPCASGRNYQRDAKDIANKRRFKRLCNDDFMALGTNADAVRNGAAHAVFLNGVGSNVPSASLYESSPVPAIQQAGRSVTGTVGDQIASPGTVAVAQLGGPNIYLNADEITSSDYFQDIAIVLHEVLHNITGLTDPDIQRALGLPQTPFSDNIAKKLLKDCF